MQAARRGIGNVGRTMATRVIGRKGHNIAPRFLNSVTQGTYLGHTDIANRNRLQVNPECKSSIVNNVECKGDAHLVIGALIKERNIDTTDLQSIDANFIGTHHINVITDTPNFQLPSRITLTDNRLLTITTTSL